MKLQDIITSVHTYLPAADVEAIRKAYTFARDHHQGQTRASGEPYITHVTDVAFLATKIRLDVPSIITALLHDSVEDTGASLEDIRLGFGDDIAELVDGVTKLNQVTFSSREEAQAENFRKMLLAMARDLRVVLIKLCDRLHNMRTLEFLSEARQSRIAQETIDIYAPLAHRLGIYWIKSELEDLSLRYLKPGVYEKIKENVAKSRKDRERYIDDVVQLIERELSQNHISGQVTGRPKHFYSIYLKMETHAVNFDEIFDLIAFRVLVPTTMECYAALGVLHSAWKPIPGRFKDYIAMPKPNGYQSLHTTVIGPQAARIEIQIRTPEMHEVAEGGIAAHWAYKDKGVSKGLTRDGLQFNWLKDLVESEKMLRDPFEFMSIVKEDLFPSEVFVFSPRGDLIALPAGSTPIDFAYHIHSDLGHHCTGARIDGLQVPLTYSLKNGDTVEVITSPNQTPSKDWIGIVATSKAKQRIRSWLRTEERDRSVAIGKELFAKDLKKVRLTLPKIIKDGSLARVAQDLGYRDIDLLFAEIAYGRAPLKQLFQKLTPEGTDVDAKLAEEESTLKKIFKRAARVIKEQPAGVTINGMDDVVFRFASCCDPLPGESLVGYVTRGRGVTIHARSCSQSHSFDPRRLISVSWDDKTPIERKVIIRVLAEDRLGVLAAMSQTLTGMKVNIINAHLLALPDGKSTTTFEINVNHMNRLEEVVRHLEGVDGVIRVEREKRAQPPESELQVE